MKASGMKGLIILLSVLLAVVFAIVGCGTPASTTSTPAAPTTSSAPPVTTQPASTAAAPPASTSPVTSSPTATQAGQGQYGGTLREIVGSLPVDLGYPPTFTPGDVGFAGITLDRLLTWDKNGNYIPVLATSWDQDPANKTITWHLRKGVKFTDGSDFNASVLKWNYQLQAGSMAGGNLIQSMDVVDPYTLVVHVSSYNRLLVEDYGWPLIISEAAFEKAANGNQQQGQNWALKNAVGTGPFEITDFKQGVSITYKRNDNYWGPKPYLDGIVETLIPDNTTATMMMKAQDSDTWGGLTVDIRDAIELQNQGLNVNYGPGLGMAILFNSSDPTSIYHDIRVREAIEYAINRPVLAQTVGFGKYEALTQLANSEYLGYNPGFDPRPYNVAKAKQLLAEAGYPNGFQTTLLTQNPNLDAATSIQAYLKQVGITVNLDVADTPRYLSSLFIPGKGGWSGLALAAWGINPDATDMFIHFGPQPMTFRTGNIWKSQTFLDLANQALQTYDQAQFVTLLKQLVEQASNDAMVDPLYTTVNPYVMQTYVHSNYPMIHGLVWNVWQDWMEKH